MIYLPDTNVWIRFLNPGESAVKRRLASVDETRLRLCSVVKAELYCGAEKSGRKTKNLATLDELFSGIESFPFDDAAARQYGMVRAALSLTGTPIGPNDLMIAAIALTHAAVVVTHNLREFSRVPGLQLEDWEAD
jgi:tRNA(fMet)-specific endonuclease VapC